MTSILDLEKQAEEHMIAKNYEAAIKYYEKIHKHPNKKPK